jgi:hypothetical protein
MLRSPPLSESYLLRDDLKRSKFIWAYLDECGIKQAAIQTPDGYVVPGKCQRIWEMTVSN